MARKFSIPEEDFMITTPVQKESEVKSEEVSKKEEKIETILPVPEERAATMAEPVPVVNNQSHAIVVSEPNENDYVKVRVGRIQKKEAMSVKKMILLKPSVNDRIMRVLQTKLPDVSFNSVVNQLIEGWLDEVDTIDSEK